MKKLRVLLTNDEEEFVETLADRLKLRDLEASTADNGEEALPAVTDETLLVRKQQRAKVSPLNGDHIRTTHGCGPARQIDCRLRQPGSCGGRDPVAPPPAAAIFGLLRGLGIVAAAGNDDVRQRQDASCRERRRRMTQEHIGDQVVVS